MMLSPNLLDFLQKSKKNRVESIFIKQLLLLPFAFCLLPTYGISLFKRIISWQTKTINFVIVSVLTFSLIINLNPVAFGQTNNLLSPSLNSSDTPNAEIVYASITLDDRELFQIAALAGSGINLGSKNSTSPLEMRVKMYENNLQQILQTGFDPATLQFSIEKGETQNLIVAADGDRLTSQPVIAITKFDAQIYGLSESDLAQELINIIKNALIIAQKERSPDYLQSQFFLSGGLIVGAILVSILLVLLQKKSLKKYQQRCQEEEGFKEGLTSNNNGEDEENKLLVLQRKQNFNSLFRGTLQISHVVLWVGSITWILGRFPQTRWLHNWLVIKSVVVAIALGTYLGIKASAVLIDWLLKKWLDSQSMTSASSSRMAARITTVSQVIKGVVSVTLAAIGIIWILHQLHIPIAPVLAGAGIIGFAISFSSQNLIRDIINGALILLEDQYALGDIINVGHASGAVENMNLRMSQLRGVDGRLSTVPNSSITTVHNLTKDWSRINFTVEVDYDSDPTEAVEVVKQVAEELAKDEEWGERVLEPADVLGVNNLSHNGIEVVIWIRTLPGFQWSVAREFRRRLKIAFDDAGIPIGVPQRSLLFQTYPTMFGDGFDGDMDRN